MKKWTPAGEGLDFSLSPTLEALSSVKDHICVLSGLTADKARPHGDGGGDQCSCSLHS
ncbi:MAG: DUF1552 domain-containing protein [Pirellulales bacterium]